MAFLEEFGKGLQNAGAILSPKVYQQQAEDRRNALVDVTRALQIKQATDSMQADQKFSEYMSGLQPTSMNDPGAMLDAMKNVPMDVLASSPRAHQTMQLVSQVQARQDAAQARKEQVQFRYDQLEQQGELARQRADDTRLGIQERAANERRHQALMLELGKMRDATAREGIDLRKDMYREKVDTPVQDLIQDVDNTIRMIKENPGVTGATGMFSRGKEVVSSALSGDANTPANDFQSQLLQIQSKWRKLPGVAANRFKSDAGKIDSLIKGLGVGSTDAITINNLSQLRENLARGLEQRGGEVPQGEQKTGHKQGDKMTSKSGRPMTFNGSNWVYEDGGNSSGQ